MVAPVTMTKFLFFLLLWNKGTGTGKERCGGGGGQGKDNQTAGTFRFLPEFGAGSR